MLLKSEPHLLHSTPAARLLYLLMVGQHHNNPTKKPRSSPLNNFGLFTLLQKRFMAIDDSCLGMAII